MSDQYLRLTFKNTAGEEVDADTLIPGEYICEAVNISPISLRVSLNEESLGIFDPGDVFIFRGVLLSKWRFQVDAGHWCLRGNFLTGRTVEQITIPTDGNIGGA